MADDSALIQGIAAYRRHPYRRSVAARPVIWAEGSARLLDYGGMGPTVLFVPSLVNRADVLDLMAAHSMLGWLAGRGVHPLLLDWGWPDSEERRFTMSDYVAGRLEHAIAAAGPSPVLAGYCMGGTLAVAAAERAGGLAGLALLAAPWDFHADDAIAAKRLAGVLPMLEPALHVDATLPIDMLQALFTLIEPHGVGDKYRAFAHQDQGSERASQFVAVEDWLNDGIPLAAAVARECLEGWYGRNSPAAGTWRIAGLPVDPRALRLPCFVAAPARDRLVPPASAEALARLIPRATLHRPAAGHIGMVAGGSAERVLWQPLLDWLTGLGPAGPAA